MEVFVLGSDKIRFVLQLDNVSYSMQIELEYRKDGIVCRI